MFLRQIFDVSLAQYAYLIGCQRTGEALLIDPERDVDRYLKIASENRLRVVAVAETHIHADFVSGTQELAQSLPSLALYLSAEGGVEWSYRWAAHHAGAVFLRHGDRFHIGSILVEVLHTPGHSPEHLSFLIKDEGKNVPIALVSGDFLFVGDVGRPDLLEKAVGAKGDMECSARALWWSIQTCLPKLPEFLQILPGHGEGSFCGKALGAVPSSVLGYERQTNWALRAAAQGEEVFTREILSGQSIPPGYFARMKRINRDGIVRTEGFSMPCRLRSDEFHRLVDTKGCRILDLRLNRREFAESHFPGALHLPCEGGLFLKVAGSFLTEEEELLLVVHDESSAEEATRQLYRIGLDAVAGYALEGDLEMTGKIPSVSFSEWEHTVLQDGALILDVRSDSEYLEGHIPRAVSIPLFSLAEQISEIPEHKIIYVHCATGKRAAMAASLLKASGWSVVFVDGVFSVEGE